MKNSKAVIIEGIYDTKSLMKSILKAFDISDSISNWDLYVTEEGSPLTENEMLWICKQNNIKLNNHYFLKRKKSDTGYGIKSFL